MASSTPWFRYYSEALHDRKLIRAAEAAEVHKLFMQGAWAGILSLASDSPIRGRLYVTFLEPFTKRDIFDELDVDETTGEKLLNALVQFGLLYIENGAYCVTNWENRQFDSDISTDRVRKYRTKMKNALSGNVSETDQTQTQTNTISKDIAPAAPDAGPSADNAHNHAGTPAPSDPSQEKPAGEKAQGGKRKAASHADPRTNSPAVRAWKVVTKRNPPLALYSRVIGVLGDTPDLDKLATVYEEWLARGYKATNIAGILKWYQNGIPPEPGQNGKVNGQPGQNGTRIVYDGQGNPVEVPL